MKEEFDFNNIGKKLPYEVEDGFFDKNADLIQGKIARYEITRRERKIVWLSICRVAAIFIIILLIGVLIRQNRQPADLAATKSVDKILKTLSDDDVKQLEYMATSDPFLASY